MVLLRCSPEGYSVSMSLLTSVIHGGKALKELARNNGKRAERLDTDSGESRSIYVYTYQHSGGICILYVNESDKYTLDEEVEFSLVGLEIENKPKENTLAFKLGPG